MFVVSRSTPFALAFAFAFFLPLVRAATSFNLTLPLSANTQHVVKSNFLGISIELSYVDLYIGSSPSLLPTPSLNYFSALHPSQSNPLRVRIGGNSMDSSTYNRTQSEILRILGGDNADDVQSMYGPALLDTLVEFGNAIGGATFMLGLSLRDPNTTSNVLFAEDAVAKLGSNLDAFLLGNEPDLYFSHGQRPGLKNYTTQNYFSDFEVAQTLLRHSAAGDLLTTPILGGPTLCCSWDLNQMIRDGYLAQFSDDLKYVSLQQYPQSNCFGYHPFGINDYVQHSFAVQVSNWQIEGINKTLKADKQIVMTEFNSVSCGGLPGLSDTFAAALWTVDYTLQLATVGYSAAYIHTREGNVSYTLFASDGNPNGTYITRPAYYALLPVIDFLSSTQPGEGGSRVIDLNLNNSRTSFSLASGYAIFDEDSRRQSGPDRILLFNNGNSSALSYHLSASLFNTSDDGGTGVQVRYLTAPSIFESENISWGGYTLLGSGNGKLIRSSSSALDDISIDCVNGCEVEVPSPGLAVVWFDGSPGQIEATSDNDISGGVSRWIALKSSRYIAVCFASTMLVLLL